MNKKIGQLVPIKIHVETIFYNNFKVLISIIQWHQRLGHLFVKRIQEMNQQNVVIGLTCPIIELFHGKFTNQIYYQICLGNDNGEKYISHVFNHFCETHGIL